VRYRGKRGFSLAKAGFEFTESCVRRVKGKARAEESLATESDLFCGGGGGILG
jgi:hypothetical protein